MLPVILPKPIVGWFGPKRVVTKGDPKLSGPKDRTVLGRFLGLLTPGFGPKWAPNWLPKTGLGTGSAIERLGVAFTKVSSKPYKFIGFGDVHGPKP